MAADYSNVSFANDGRLRLLIIVGTRPEVIRLSEVIKKCRRHFDCLLAHTGQNYDYNLNGIFFRDLSLDDPDVYMDAVGDGLGETMGNIIARSYDLMNAVKPEALLILGDTNSCLSAIAAKRLHIPIFHMEAGNRCKDECLPEETNRRIVDIISDVNLAYSEHARRYLAECGLPRERTYVTGSPMAEVLRANLDQILVSDVHERLGLEPGKYMLLSAHREENIDTQANFESLFNAINKLAEIYQMPILYSCGSVSSRRVSSCIRLFACTSPWASMTTTVCSLALTVSCLIRVPSLRRARSSRPLACPFPPSASVRPPSVPRHSTRRASLLRESMSVVW